MTITDTAPTTTGGRLAVDVDGYRRTSAVLHQTRQNRALLDAATITRLHAEREAAWERVAARAPRVARLLVAEDLLIARVHCRIHERRGHRRLDARLRSVRADITHARG